MSDPKLEAQVQMEPSLPPQLNCDMDQNQWQGDNMQMCPGSPQMQPLMIPDMQSQEVAMCPGSPVQYMQAPAQIVFNSPQQMAYNNGLQPVILSPIVMPSQQCPGQPMMASMGQVQCMSPTNLQPVQYIPMSPVSVQTQSQQPMSPTNGFMVAHQQPICITSPVPNNQTGFSEQDGITGLISPKQSNPYMLQQQFQGLFLSPRSIQNQFCQSPVQTSGYYGFQDFNQAYYPNYNDYQEPEQTKPECQKKLTYPTKYSPSRNNYTEEKKNSKRDAVNACLSQLQSIFDDKIDEAGFRGPTSLRIRVKTWSAITHIVPFLCKVKTHINVNKVSFPKSTKGLGRILRGFLAYVQVESEDEIPKIRDIFDSYQKENGKPFKKLEITTT